MLFERLLWGSISCLEIRVVVNIFIILLYSIFIKDRGIMEDTKAKGKTTKDETIGCNNATVTATTGVVGDTLRGS